MKKYSFIRYMAIAVIFTVISISAAFANPPATPRQFNDITATELVANIGVGWNLGNGLDVVPENPQHEADFRNNLTISQMESFWGHPAATRANITAVKNAGFNAIRIPVSWSKVVDSNYNIRADWMARITEVVNWAVENDMYIILNTHHDESIFKFTNSEVETSLRAFRRVWEQIAFNFRNYNEKLVFEALNEPRTVGVWYEWLGGIDEERANLNRHYQVFVDVVRASGGNNDKRILMITPYSGGHESALNGLVLPNDTVPNKLIVSIHAYEPNPFCSPHSHLGNTSTWSANNTRDTRVIRDFFTPVYNRFIRNGIPVILGEFASWDKNNTGARAAHAEYFVNHAKSLGIPCFWWDADGMSILNRYASTFDFPEIVNALMKGAGVNTPVLPPKPVVEGTAAVFPIGAWQEGSDNNSRVIRLGWHRIQGTLARDGYAFLSAVPDTATLNLMRRMKSFSFMVFGDGKRYEVMIQTTDTSVAHNNYRFTFTAPAGVATRITVNVPADLRQADWGGHGVVPFNQRNVQNFIFAPTAPGTFDIAVWDIRIIQ
ncbi:MAG: glycoside hydrolase family 5 protein [Treponema sp.]|nr:glycoside hydrolase family 5 protein [Treponema sp.]